MKNQLSLRGERMPLNAFLAVAFLLIASNLSFAQQWSGGSTPSSTISRTGTVGIGTNSPSQKLHVDNGNLLVEGNGSFNASGEVAHLYLGDTNHYIRAIHGTGLRIGTFFAGDVISIVQVSGRVGIGTTNPLTKLDVAGLVRAQGYAVYGGSDLSEHFDVQHAEAVQPGMVVAINPEEPGKLRLADKAYDHTVVGIVSGANGIQSGMTMQQEGTIADGALPVALTGRVYCWADATNGPIRPGDLLTTSDIPGHAMKVVDYNEAKGAILGKAMSSLKEGRGLVLVLVTLQ